MRGGPRGCIRAANLTAMPNLRTSEASVRYGDDGDPVGLVAERPPASLRPACHPVVNGSALDALTELKARTPDSLDEQPDHRSVRKHVANLTIGAQ